MTAIELLICTALVFVSALMSASEISLFSLSRFQLKTLKERFRSPYRKIKRLLSDPSGLLITILVVNEVVNISLSALIADSISRLPKSWLPVSLPVPDWAVNTVLGILVTAPIVLLLCDITPKIVAARANQLVAPLAAGPLSLVYDALKPARVALRRLVDLVARRDTGTSVRQGASGELQPGEDVIKESDFLLMVEEGHKEGAIQENELELIRNVFELDDTTVEDVMIPLLGVQTLSVHTTLKGAMAALKHHRFSRIPILSPDRKQVAGILYRKDLLKAKLDPNLLPVLVSSVMRKPIFVTPGMRLTAIFRRFKQTKTHMAIVQDGKEAPLGIVTMTDVLDALFDDLIPDDDAEEAAREARS